MIFLCALTLGAQVTHAQTLCDGDGGGFVERPAATFPISSNMGHRDTKIKDASKIHRGTDYATPCGTKISGPPRSCVQTGRNKVNGYGNVTQFNCGNGIKIQYAHLSTNPYNAATNLITTENSGTGGCHLDYMITLDGKVVDAQCATGTVTSNFSYGQSSVKHGVKCPFKGPINLCDAGVKSALKDHASKIFNGSNKSDYNIGDGPTSPSGDDTEHADDHHDDEEHPATILDQGTFGKDGTGGVTPSGSTVEEHQQDPEEDEPDTPKEGDKYDPSASTPVCTNSTCITEDTINNAHHKHVKDDKVKSHLKYLILKPGEKCKQPKPTGIIVKRQEIGKIREYMDAFCTNQGCSYVNTGTGLGECK